MKPGESLSLLSHLINFAIIIQFSVLLIKLDALDIATLITSAFGLFISLIANIISVIESKY